jgi:hypothetical protein
VSNVHVRWIIGIRVIAWNVSRRIERMIIAHEKRDSFTSDDEVTCTFFLTSAELVSDSRIVTVEDWVLVGNLREDITRQIMIVAERMTNIASVTEESSGPPTSEHASINMLSGYLFPIKTWTHLLEEHSLPKNLGTDGLSMSSRITTEDQRTCKSCP